MYITVTLELRHKRYDIQADDHLSIRKAVKTLDDDRRIYSGAGLPDYFRSLHQRGLVSGQYTFRQAGIQNGDLLTAVE